MHLKTWQFSASIQLCSQTPWDPITEYSLRRSIHLYMFNTLHTRTHARTHARTHTHTHTFNGPFSGTTRVSRYQKGKPIWILLEQETVSGSGISWAKMQVCTSLQTNHASTPPLSFFTCWMPFLLPNQQCQSTEGLIL